MRKECDGVKKSLRKYIRGHLFKPEQKRIERHLAACPLCNSEYQALRRIMETQEFLRDITPPEGVAQKVKSGVSRLQGFRKLLYRPLWLVLIAGAAAALYFYVINPILHDPDIERLEAPPVPPQEEQQQPVSAPSVSAPAAAAPPPVPAKQEAPPVPTAAPKAPVEITITVENEKLAVMRLNDVMKEHALLGKKRFSDSAQEVAGTMTAHEIRTFLSRIEVIGRIRYKRSRLANADGDELFPFVLKLIKAPSAAPPAGAQPVGKPVETSADKPVKTPVENPVDKSAPQPVPQPAPAQ